MEKDKEINLEKGLCFYYENEKYFQDKDIPVDKQVALGYEAGRHETIERVLKTVKLGKEEKNVVGK